MANDDEASGADGGLVALLVVVIGGLRSGLPEVTSAGVCGPRPL